MGKCVVVFSSISKSVLTLDCHIENVCNFTRLLNLPILCCVVDKLNFILVFKTMPFYELCICIYSICSNTNVLVVQTTLKNLKWLITWHLQLRVATDSFHWTNMANRLTGQTFTRLCSLNNTSAMYIYCKSDKQIAWTALRFIPQWTQKKDTHALYLQCFQQGPFLKFSDKRYKIKIPTATGTYHHFM